MLLAVLAVAGQTRDAGAAVEIEGSMDLAGRQVLLVEAIGTALAPDLEGAGVVAGLGDEVDGAADQLAPKRRALAPLKISMRLTSISSMDSKSLKPSAWP